MLKPINTAIVNDTEITSINNAASFLSLALSLIQIIYVYKFQILVCLPQDV